MWLAELGHDVRIDHRFEAELGLSPQNKIGPTAARRAREGEEGERTEEHHAIARRNGERLLAASELALQALTHQQSAFTRQDLAQLVHRQSDGAAQFAAIMAKVEASPDLVRVGQDGRRRAQSSTVEMVQVERRLAAVATVLDNRTTHRVEEARRLAPADGGQLGEEQRLAPPHVTRSRNLAVVGIAGGGKSTMLGTARAAWHAQGCRVRGAALSGIAAEGLKGSAGLESRTIASWEYAWQQGKEELTAQDVLMLDETRMVGSRQLDRLLRRVHRIILARERVDVRTLNGRAPSAAPPANSGRTVSHRPNSRCAPLPRATGCVSCATSAVSASRMAPSARSSRSRGVETMRGCPCGWMRRAEGVAQAERMYDAIRADESLLAELSRFEDAVVRRTAYGGPVGNPARPRQIPDEERKARWSQGVLAAARDLGAWRPVL